MENDKSDRISSECGQKSCGQKCCGGFFAKFDRSRESHDTIGNGEVCTGSRISRGIGRLKLWFEGKKVQFQTTHQKHKHKTKHLIQPLSAIRHPQMYISFTLPRQISSQHTRAEQKPTIAGMRKIPVTLSLKEWMEDRRQEDNIRRHETPKNTDKRSTR